MLKKLALLTSGAALLLPAIAMAHPSHSTTTPYQDPTDVITVTQLLENTMQYDERNVSVQGEVVAQVSHDEYLIADAHSNRRILIEIESEAGFHQALKKGEVVRVFGEFDQGNQPEIEVSHLSVIRG